MSIIFLILFLLPIIGFFLDRFSQWKNTAFYLIIYGSIAFALCLAFVSGCLYNNIVFVEQHDELTAQLQKNTENESEKEKEELNKQIKQHNQKLLEYQYDNEHFFAICVSSEVAKLQPLPTY